MKTFRSSTPQGICILPLLALSLAGLALADPDLPNTGKIAPQIQHYVDEHELAGAVMLVASPEKILDCETVGWMDVKAQQRMRPDSLFWIASQSKPITATALMILVDEGKVKLDDPVEKYVPEFKDLWAPDKSAQASPGETHLKRPQHPIMVREILSHTSGLEAHSAIETPTLDLYPLETRVRSYTIAPLLFEPGGSYKYSNAGINTAGRIVEVVTHMPFEKFLEERIFTPLGMKDTTFHPSSEQLTRLAKSYKAVNHQLEETPIGQLKYPLDSPDRQAMPAGGLFSTAQDLSLFYRMLANGGEFAGKRIVSAQAIKQMTRKQTGDLPESYGFAFSINGASFGHGGAYGTHSEYNGDHQLITIYLVQHASWGAHGKEVLPAFRKIAFEAFGEKPAPAAAQAGPAPAANHAAAVTPALVVCNRVRFYPAPHREKALLGGKFTGSNVSETAGFQTLAEIKSTPAPDQWGELTFPNHQAYRWLRYEAPPGSAGNVAEIEFYADDQKLKGPGFGSAGYVAPGGHWKTALDGKPETWFNSSTADGQYVGIDLLDRASVARPALIPGPGDFATPQRITLKCSTPGAILRYTTDGSLPATPSDGLAYGDPIPLDQTTTLVAVAFKEGVAVSPDVHGTYVIGATAHPPVNSFHVGNSLTGNTSGFPMYARSAGYTHHYASYLRGGALTVQLWKAKDGEDKARFADLWSKAAQPLDHFTLQPRDFNVAEEVEYSQKFLDLVRQSSPNVQPWLYAEWEEVERQRPSDKALVPSSQMKKLWPTQTWEESMSAMLLYVEEVQHQLAATDHSGKRVRIIPASLAMGWICNMIRNGKAPGVVASQGAFESKILEDHVHVNANGSYLVDLVWFGALYQQSPVGRVYALGAHLTSPQAKLFQELAWDVVQNYPDCGLYQEGKEPCAKPEILKEGKQITLHSATPGVWYRYTLDGTTPTRTRGYVYCGVITDQPGIQVKAIAYKSGMADSAITEGALSP